jgi:hypothetical protein
MNKQLIANSAHLIVLLCLVSVGTMAHAQICSEDNTPETISLSNFDLSQAGEVKINSPSKPLTWQRCFYGQTWNSATQNCDGSPRKMTWQEALNAANDSGNWRLPNIKELLDIIDLQCFAPPLHPELFPSAPASLSSGIWTSSPLQTNLGSTQTTTSAWIIDLGHGKLGHQKITALNFVLLVKSQ